MATWKIQIPEQELEWESSDEPEIKLVIDGMPDHRYLLDYDATMESQPPDCPHCGASMERVQWVQIVKKDEFNFLDWDDKEAAWLANEREGTEYADYHEPVEAWVQCGECNERIEVRDDFEVGPEYYRVEPKPWQFESEKTA